MLHFLQVYKLIQDKTLFIQIFDDLSYEINTMGYKGFESDLVFELLDNHFGITLEDEKQLDKITRHILEYQGKLEKHCKTLEVLFRKAS